MKQRNLLLSVLILLAILTLRPDSIAAAEAASSAAWTFAPLRYEPFAMTLEGACDATETATQAWRFGLPVTGDLLADLETAVAQGNAVYVETGSTTGIDIEGNGSAAVDATYELVIFDASTGRRTVHDSAFRSHTLPHVDGMRVVLRLEEVAITRLEAGDRLLVEIGVAAMLQAEGCDASSRAPVLSAYKWVDASSPYLALQCDPDQALDTVVFDPTGC